MLKKGKAMESHSRVSYFLRFIIFFSLSLGAQCFAGNVDTYLARIQQNPENIEVIRDFAEWLKSHDDPNYSFWGDFMEAQLDWQLH